MRPTSINWGSSAAGIAILCAAFYIVFIIGQGTQDMRENADAIALSPVNKQIADTLGQMTELVELLGRPKSMDENLQGME